MSLPRVHAVEFHDLPGCPTFVRETIVETLGNALRWGRIYDAAADTFWEFLREARVDSMLDLCSGSGEPVATLLEALERRGVPLPHYALSDLYPNRGRLAQVAARFPGRVEIVDSPVDATSVAPSIDRPGRSIISAFHHFAPDVASQIIADCVVRQRALFVLEPAPRDFDGAFGFAPWLVAGMVLNPLVAPANRWAKALGTYASPLSAAVVAWDSLVSMLRMHTDEELLEMVRDVAGYRWQYRRIPARRGVDVTVFMGWPE